MLDRKEGRINISQQLEKAGLPKNLSLNIFYEIKQNRLCLSTEKKNEREGFIAKAEVTEGVLTLSAGVRKAFVANCLLPSKK